MTPPAPSSEKWGPPPHVGRGEAVAILKLNRPARCSDNGVEFGHDRLAADHALSGRHQQSRAGRQIEVRAAAEADVAKALARRHRLAWFDIADDAARHPPSDLYAADHTAIDAPQRDRHALVLVARLVGRGVQKLARPVSHDLDGRRARRAV